jgi:hypothetical protein
MKIIAFMFFALVAASPASGNELVSRCMSVEPVCRPGTRPMCICENDYSFRCAWICGSNGQ